MQSPEFDMKAQQTRREGQTRQESTPGREANMKTELPLETTHMPTSFRRQKRESLRTRLSTWSIKITSFSLNNFTPEEFFGEAKSVSMNGPKFSNATGIMKAFLVERKKTLITLISLPIFISGIFPSLCFST